MPNPIRTIQPHNFRKFFKKNIIFCRIHLTLDGIVCKLIVYNTITSEVFYGTYIDKS